MANIHGFVEQLAALSEAGKPYVCVTIVHARGSIPQEIGSKMLVTEQGLAFGTVGGGRIEHRAIEESLGMLKSTEIGQTTRLLEWNLKRDIGMTCGGTITLFFEAFNRRSWDIVVFGAGHVSCAVSRILTTLDCQLTVVDSRREWIDKLPTGSNLTPLVYPSPEDYCEQIPDGAYVLVMTMGHRTDKPILERILKAGRLLAYLGVIGSKGKRVALRKELIASGLAEDVADSFRCPIGLPLGSNEPGEIAISVAAELLQVRDSIRSQTVKLEREANVE